MTTMTSNPITHVPRLQYKTSFVSGCTALFPARILEDEIAYWHCTSTYRHKEDPVTCECVCLCVSECVCVSSNIPCKQYRTYWTFLAVHSFNKFLINWAKKKILKMIIKVSYCVSSHCNRQCAVWTECCGESQLKDFFPVWLNVRVVTSLSCLMTNNA